MNDPQSIETPDSLRECASVIPVEARFINGLKIEVIVEPAGP